MMRGIVHEVVGVQMVATVEWWVLRCSNGIGFYDGMSDADIRVGQWTYPTCLECAAR